MNEDKLSEMLRILEEQYEKDPPCFVTSSNLRAKLGLSVEEMRPYAEAIYEEGYGQTLKGFSDTFIVRLNERGHKAFIKYGE